MTADTGPPDKLSIVVFSGHYDKVHYALVMASAAAADTEERNLLGRQQSIQSLRNILNLLPTEKQKLDAQLSSARICIQNAKRDLERTTITLPFDARIAEVNVE